MCEHPIEHRQYFPEKKTDYECRLCGAWVCKRVAEPLPRDESGVSEDDTDKKGKAAD
jgi:hypothetical protein